MEGHTVGTAYHAECVLEHGIGRGVVPLDLQYMSASPYPSSQEARLG